MKQFVILVTTFVLFFLQLASCAPSVGSPVGTSGGSDSQPSTESPTTSDTVASNDDEKYATRHYYKATDPEVASRIKADGRSFVTSWGISIDWTASALEFCADCEGELKLTVRAESVGARFKIFVDGEEKGIYTSKGNKVFTVKDIARGVHTVRLLRTSMVESGNNCAAAELTTISMNGVLLDRPADNPYYIEFLGDSVTCGYGTVAGDTTAYGDEAYAYKTARALGADYSVVSVSGIGTLTSTSRHGNLNISDLIPYYNYYRSQKVNYVASRQADLVVIATNANDSDSLDKSTYQDQVRSIISEMQRIHGTDTKFIWLFNMYNLKPNLNSHVEEVFAELGGTEAGFYTLTLYVNSGGAAGHPLESAQTDYAARLADFIKQKDILSSKTNSDTEPDPGDMPSDEKLLLNGVNVSSYKIVYAQSPLDKSVGSLTGKTVRGDIGDMLQGSETECDFDYQSAVRLQKLIKELYGYELAVVKDTDATVRSKYEIVVGETNRTILGKVFSLTDEKYVACFDTYTPSQYVICGGSWGATWHAIDALESYLKAHKNDAVVDLKAAGDLSGSYDLKAVACVGDSITRGSQSVPDANGYGNASGLAASWGTEAKIIYFEQYFSYPAVVQRELWKDYLVYNYGVGGTTMRNYGNSAYYQSTSKWQACLNQSNRSDFSFDLVLIMLGTNDIGQMGSSWSATARADFLKETKSMCDQLLAGSPQAKFVYMNAPHICNISTQNSLAKAMREGQAQVVETLKTDGYDIALYDMNQYCIANMGTGCASSQDAEYTAHSDYYNINTDTGTPDPLHPNYRGYGKIAEGMVDLLKYLLENGEKPQYLAPLRDSTE